MIHYPPEPARREGLVDGARAVFPGEVGLARDLMELPL